MTDKPHLSMLDAEILKRALIFAGVSTGVYKFNDLYKLDKRGLLRQISQRQFVITDAGRAAINAPKNPLVREANHDLTEAQATAIAQAITYRRNPAPFRYLVEVKAGVFKAYYGEDGTPQLTALMAQMEKQDCMVLRYSNARGEVEVTFTAKAAANDRE